VPLFLNKIMDFFKEIWDLIKGIGVLKKGKVKYDGNV